MDLKYLNNTIILSRIPISAIAEKLGISRTSLYNKLSGKHDFKVSEISKLCEILRLTEQERLLIFLADEADKEEGQP